MRPGSGFLEQLATYGFAQIDGVRHSKDVHVLTSELGDIRMLNGHEWFTLTPKSQSKARSSSFSKRFGFGRFPLHSDTAFWECPARYTIFHSEAASSTSTMVLPAKETKALVEKHRASNPIFVRKSVSGVSYATPWFGRTSEFIRYDPCYMTPANLAAERFMESVEEQFDSAERVTWASFKLLVIDNWRVLHGRERVEDETRRLARQYRG